MTKICTQCGREFTPNVHNQQTCSAECRAKLQAQHRRRHYLAHEAPEKPYFERKTCVICGKEFVAYRPHCKACSPECSREVKKQGVLSWHKRHPHYSRDLRHAKGISLRYNQISPAKPEVYIKYLSKLEARYGELGNDVLKRAILSWSDDNG